MLTLPITQEWLHMIVTGEKLEEYREIKPYWTKRLQTIGLLDENENPTLKTTNIALRNGYGRDAAEAVVRVTIKKSTGRKEWGAKPGEVYYVLRIREIITTSSNLNQLIQSSRTQRQRLFGG